MLIKASTLASLALPLLSLSDYTSASSVFTSSSTFSTKATKRYEPNLERWAEYSRSIQATNGRRAAMARRADLVGVPQPRYSPLPPLNGETITKTVAQQIKVGEGQCERVLRRGSGAVRASMHNHLFTTFSGVDGACVRFSC